MAILQDDVLMACAQIRKRRACCNVGVHRPHSQPFFKKDSIFPILLDDDSHFYTSLYTLCICSDGYVIARDLTFR